MVFSLCLQADGSEFILDHGLGERGTVCIKTDVEIVFQSAKFVLSWSKTQPHLVMSGVDYTKNVLNSRQPLGLRNKSH
jgi:hypothetical protein